MGISACMMVNNGLVTSSNARCIVQVLIVAKAHIPIGADLTERLGEKYL